MGAPRNPARSKLGTWNALQCVSSVRWSDDELLEDLHRVACKVGRIPTWAQYEAYGKSSRCTLGRHFGSQTQTLARYRTWLEAHHPKTPWLAALPQQEPCTLPISLSRKWVPKERPEFGPPLNFRNLRN